VSHSKSVRARIGAATYEYFARPARAFPDHHHRLRVARVASGITQVELAARANLSAGVVSRIERGEQRGSLTTKRQLAAALGKPVEELWPA
jgi:DNA-binding XRE family transcriptional regulator